MNTQVENNSQELPWRPTFTSWRHGGWYVNNVHYLGGACGCVSNNYDDHQWRIVCDSRRGDLRQPGDFTFPSRQDAALAERELALAQVAQELQNWHGCSVVGAYHQQVGIDSVIITPDQVHGFGVVTMRAEQVLKPARFTGCFEQALGWGKDEIAALRLAAEADVAVPA